MPTSARQPPGTGIHPPRAQPPQQGPGLGLPLGLGGFQPVAQKAHQHQAAQAQYQGKDQLEQQLLPPALPLEAEVGEGQTGGDPREGQIRLIGDGRRVAQHLHIAIGRWTQGRLVEGLAANQRLGADGQQGEGQIGELGDGN